MIGSHEIAAGIRVGFNDKNKTLIITQYITPIPGFKGDWQEVAKFTDGPTWYASDYAKLCTNEYVEDMITWFWIDIQETC